MPDGRAQRAALADLVAYSLEEDDEGVRGDADGDDESDDPGHGQAVSDGPRQEGDDEVGEPGRQGDGADRHDTQALVRPQQVQSQQNDADHPGHQARPERLGAEGGGDLLLGLDLEL